MRGCHVSPGQALGACVLPSLTLVCELQAPNHTVVLPSRSPRRKRAMAGFKGIPMDSRFQCPNLGSGLASLAHSLSYLSNKQDTTSNAQCTVL